MKVIHSGDLPHPECIHLFMSLRALGVSPMGFRPRLMPRAKTCWPNLTAFSYLERSSLLHFHFLLTVRPGASGTSVRGVGMEKGSESILRSASKPFQSVPGPIANLGVRELIQHVRRKVAHLLPSSSETSIPLSAVVQTTIASVFFVTLRLSFPLVTGVVLTVVRHPIEVPSQWLWVLTTTVLADRSAVAYLRIRRS